MREGQQHADRDRHVHVGPAVPRAPARPSGRRRARNRRAPAARSPPTASGTGRASRHRRRTRPTTDSSMMLPAAKPATASARTSSRQCRSFAVVAGIVQCASIAGAAQRLDAAAAALAPPAHRHAPGRKVDARLLDAGKAAQRALDRRDAGAAMDRRARRDRSGAGRPRGRGSPAASRRATAPPSSAAASRRMRAAHRIAL